MELPDIIPYSDLHKYPILWAPKLWNWLKYPKILVKDVCHLLPVTGELTQRTGLVQNSIINIHAKQTSFSFALGKSTSYFLSEGVERSSSRLFCIGLVASLPIVPFHAIRHSPLFLSVSHNLVFWLFPIFPSISCMLWMQWNKQWGKLYQYRYRSLLSAPMLSVFHCKKAVLKLCRRPLYYIWNFWTHVSRKFKMKNWQIEITRTDLIVTWGSSPPEPSKYGRNPWIYH